MFAPLGSSPTNRKRTRSILEQPRPTNKNTAPLSPGSPTSTTTKPDDDSIFGAEADRLLQITGTKTEAWAKLRSTTFARYVFNKAFVVDIAKLDHDWCDLVFHLLSRIPTLHVLRLTDTFHSSSRHRRDRQGLWNATERRFQRPSEHQLERYCKSTIAPALLRHHARLRHLEFVGLHLPAPIWRPIFASLSQCASLRQLYLRNVNITDQMLIDIVDALSSVTVQHFACTGCGLTSFSGTTICRLIQSQACRRDDVRWQEGLRGDISPDLLSHLEVAGLISVDVSNNKLGDVGIQTITSLLSRDSWILAIDLRNNGFDRVGLESVISMIRDNSTLVTIKVADSQPNHTQHGSRTFREFSVHKYDPHIHRRQQRLLQFQQRKQWIMPVLDLIVDDHMMLNRLVPEKRLKEVVSVYAKKQPELSPRSIENDRRRFRIKYRESAYDMENASRWSPTGHSRPGSPRNRPPSAPTSPSISSSPKRTLFHFNMPSSPLSNNLVSPRSSTNIASSSTRATTTTGPSPVVLEQLVAKMEQQLLQLQERMSNNTAYQELVLENERLKRELATLHTQESTSHPEPPPSPTPSNLSTASWTSAALATTRSAKFISKGKKRGRAVKRPPNTVLASLAEKPTHSRTPPTTTEPDLNPLERSKGEIVAMMDTLDAQFQRLEQYLQLAEKNRFKSGGESTQIPIRHDNDNIQTRHDDIQSRHDVDEEDQESESIDRVTQLPSRTQEPDVDVDVDIVNDMTIKNATTAEFRQQVADRLQSIWDLHVAQDG